MIDDDPPNRLADLAMQPMPRRGPIDGDAVVEALTRVIQAQISLAQSVNDLVSNLNDVHHVMDNRVPRLSASLSRFQRETKAATDALKRVADSIK